MTILGLISLFILISVSVVSVNRFDISTKASITSSVITLLMSVIPSTYIIFTLIGVK